MNTCLWSCSLSWSERDLTASQPGSKLIQMGLKHPRQELTHELPGGKLASKMHTVMLKKVPLALKVTNLFVFLLLFRS